MKYLIRAGVLVTLLYAAITLFSKAYHVDERVEEIQNAEWPRAGNLFAIAVFERCLYDKGLPLTHCSEGSVTGDLPAPKGRILKRQTFLKLCIGGSFERSYISGKHYTINLINCRKDHEELQIKITVLRGWAENDFWPTHTVKAWLPTEGDKVWILTDFEKELETLESRYI